MGVKIKKRGGKWYVYVNYHGRRKAKCIGSSREVAEKVQRQLEAASLSATLVSSRAM